MLAEGVRADEFAMLVDDRAALEARVGMIQNAQQEICLATFSLDSSYIPTVILTELLHKAQVGVRVRVIVDGLAAKFSSDVERFLTKGGVEIGIYHPLLTGHPSWLNRRLHSKLIVVDRSVMVIGSRNLKDAHFGLEKANFIDYDAIVSGPVCCVGQNYFETLWHSSDVRPIDECITVHRQDINTATETHAKALERFEYGVESESCSHETTRVIGIETNEVCLLTDQETSKSERSMAETVGELINTAQRSVVIETPYPAFSESFIKTLLSAVARGVSVTLITNSLSNTDQVMVYAAYQSQKARLLRSGIQLFEFPGPDRLHAKGMLIDQRLAMIGSYNFDARSELLNLELCLLTTNADAVAAIEHIIGHHQTQAARIDPSQSSTSPNAAWTRRLQLRSAQLVAPLLRPSL